MPEHHVASCTAAALDDWHPILASLNDVLGQLETRMPQLTFVVSNRFVRFALIPWSPVALKPAEETLLIDARFNELYGDMAGWQVQADAGRYGAARLACALPVALVQALRQLGIDRRARGITIVPYFIACWNHWCRQAPAAVSAQTEPRLFAVAESGRLVVAGVTPSGWSHLRTVTLPDAEDRRFVDGLAAALSREYLVQGHTQALPFALCAPDLGAGERDALAGRLDTPLEWICMESNGEDATIRMAQLGIEGHGR